MQTWPYRNTLSSIVTGLELRRTKSGTVNWFSQIIARTHHMQRLLANHSVIFHSWQQALVDSACAKQLWTQQNNMTWSLSFLHMMWACKAGRLSSLCHPQDTGNHNMQFICNIAATVFIQDQTTVIKFLKNLKNKLWCWWWCLFNILLKCIVSGLTMVCQIISQMVQSLATHCNATKYDCYGTQLVVVYTTNLMTTT